MRHVSRATDGWKAFISILACLVATSRFPNPLKFDRFVPLVPSRIEHLQVTTVMASIHLLRRRRHLGPVRDRTKTITRFTLRHLRVPFLFVRSRSMHPLSQEHES